MKFRCQPIVAREFDANDPLANQFEEIRNPDRVVRFVATDDSLDRYDEVVLPRGVDFSNFAKNSVLMQFHDYGMWPIGKNVAGEVRGNEILLDAEFDPPEIDAQADLVFKKIKHGTVKTGSIGFIPKTVVRRSDKGEVAKELMAQYPNAERIYSEWELLEFSVVPVPANPNALAAAYQEAAQRRFGSRSNAASDPEREATQEALDNLIRDFGIRIDELNTRIKSYG